MSGSVEDSIILLSSDSESSNINDIEKSYSILMISRHKPHDKTKGLADHCKVVTHMTTTPWPSSPVILNLPEHLNQSMHFNFI